MTVYQQLHSYTVECGGREEEDPAVPQESLEKSMELQSFQQAVSQLEAIEEEIVEQHRMILQVASYWCLLSRHLLLCNCRRVDSLY